MMMMMMTSMTIVVIIIVSIVTSVTFTVRMIVSHLYTFKKIKLLRSSLSTESQTHRLRSLLLRTKGSKMLSLEQVRI